MTVVQTYWVGLDSMLEEIDRVTLVDEPYRITGPLNVVLRAAFEDTQFRVASPAHPHVATYQPTGALLESGRVDQDFDGDTWTGTITYGGRSHDVVYAIYEMARGGIHDWFSGLPAFGPQYLQAIESYWRTGV
jgi:hypothetical protein